MESDDSIAQQLIVAVETSNFENLISLLSRTEEGENDDGDFAVITDSDIYKALGRVARKGCIESCRLIFDSLSPSRKEHFVTTSPFLYLVLICGQVQLARWLLDNFDYNVNQLLVMGNRSYTPLSCAIMQAEANCLELCRLLLEKGADPNQMRDEYEYSALWYAVMREETDILRLLLEHGADPNHNHVSAPRENNEDDQQQQQSARDYLPIDVALHHANTEIISLLLHHGALVERTNEAHEMLLYYLLQDPNISRATKLSIGGLFVEHAAVVDESGDTAYLMISTLERAIRCANIDGCEILLEAGIRHSINQFLYYAIQEEQESPCRLFVQHGADPFVQEDDGYDDYSDEQAASPFLAAARHDETGIFAFFLELWDEKYSTNGGKNNNGLCPVNVICRDKHVSLPAMELVLQREADALVAAQIGEDGHFLFHEAAMSNVSVDVLFCLLKHSPDALRNVDVHGPKRKKRKKSD